MRWSHEPRLLDSAASVLPRHFRRYVLGACLLVAGCASNANETVPHRSIPASPPVVAKLRAGGVTSALLARRFVREYRASDWGGVQRAFNSTPAANDLIAEMQTWKAENATNLHVAVVYRRDLPRHRFIVTLQFTSDPRAIPYYVSYALTGSGPGARVQGTVTGISGATFTTANWSVSRSQHFVVYHSMYQLQGRDRRFLAELEYQRTEFMRKFGVKLAPLIHYYYYPVQRLMSPMTRGACGSSPELVGCANPYTAPPTIHTSLWPTYHEPIHVYELALEPPVRDHRSFYVAPLLLAEGTAVALEDREVDPRLSDYCSYLSYTPLDQCARRAVHGVRPLNLLSDAGFKHADPSNAYILGGSFVKYLILHYGYHRFGRFYYVLAAQPRDRQGDYDVAAHQVFGRSIAQVIDAWLHDLCRPGC